MIIQAIIINHRERRSRIKKAMRRVDSDLLDLNLTWYHIEDDADGVNDVVVCGIQRDVK